MARSADGPVTRWRSIATSPRVGRMSPLAMRKSVVLPQPLGPRSDTKVPLSTASETPRSAQYSPAPSRPA